MAKYLAFLRGINVGGNKSVPMAKAKFVMEELGFTEVRTVLASGNIIFEGRKENPSILAKKIGTRLEQVFGFTIPVIIRDAVQIEKIAESDTFKGIEVKKDTRLYVYISC